MQQQQPHHQPFIAWSIACYRDSQLLPTLQSGLYQAHFASRILPVVCWQGDLQAPCCSCTSLSSCNELVSCDQVQHQHKQISNTRLASSGCTSKRQVSQAVEGPANPVAYYILPRQAAPFTSPITAPAGSALNAVQVSKKPVYDATSACPAPVHSGKSNVDGAPTTLRTLSSFSKELRISPNQKKNDNSNIPSSSTAHRLLCEKKADEESSTFVSCCSLIESPYETKKEPAYSGCACWCHSTATTRTCGATAVLQKPLQSVPFVSATPLKNTDTLGKEGKSVRGRRAVGTAVDPQPPSLGWLRRHREIDKREDDAESSAHEGQRNPRVTASDKVDLPKGAAAKAVRIKAAASSAAAFLSTTAASSPTARIVLPTLDVCDKEFADVTAGKHIGATVHTAVMRADAVDSSSSSSSPKRAISSKEVLRFVKRNGKSTSSEKELLRVGSTSRLSAGIHQDENTSTSEKESLPVVVRSPLGTSNHQQEHCANTKAPRMSGRGFAEVHHRSPADGNGVWSPAPLTQKKGLKGASSQETSTINATARTREEDSVQFMSDTKKRQRTPVNKEAFLLAELYRTCWAKPPASSHQHEVGARTPHDDGSRWRTLPSVCSPGTCSSSVTTGCGYEYSSASCAGGGNRRGTGNCFSNRSRRPKSSSEGRRPACNTNSSFTSTNCPWTSSSNSNCDRLDNVSDSSLRINSLTVRKGRRHGDVVTTTSSSRRLAQGRRDLTTLDCSETRIVSDDSVPVTSSCCNNSPVRRALSPHSGRTLSSNWEDSPSLPHASTSCCSSNYDSDSLSLPSSSRASRFQESCPCLCKRCAQFSSAPSCGPTSMSHCPTPLSSTSSSESRRGFHTRKKKIPRLRGSSDTGLCNAASAAAAGAVTTFFQNQPLCNVRHLLPLWVQQQLLLLPSEEISDGRPRAKTTACCSYSVPLSAGPSVTARFHLLSVQLLPSSTVCRMSALGRVEQPGALSETDFSPAIASGRLAVATPTSQQLQTTHGRQSPDSHGHGRTACVSRTTRLCCAHFFSSGEHGEYNICSSSSRSSRRGCISHQHVKRHYSTPNGRTNNHRRDRCQSSQRRRNACKYDQICPSDYYCVPSVSTSCGVKHDSNCGVVTLPCVAQHSISKSFNGSMEHFSFTRHRKETTSSESSCRNASNSSAIRTSESNCSCRSSFRRCSREKRRTSWDGSSCSMPAGYAASEGERLQLAVMDLEGPCAAPHIDGVDNTLTSPPDSVRIRLVFVDWRSSRGPCFARYICEQVLPAVSSPCGELLLLQTDSHMRFAPHYDCFLVRQLYLAATAVATQRKRCMNTDAEDTTSSGISTTGVVASGKQKKRTSPDRPEKNCTAVVACRALKHSALDGQPAEGGEGQAAAQGGFDVSSTCRSEGLTQQKECQSALQELGKERDEEKRGEKNRERPHIRETSGEIRKVTPCAEKNGALKIATHSRLSGQRLPTSSTTVTACWRRSTMLSSSGLPSKECMSVLSCCVACGSCCDCSCSSCSCCCIAPETGWVDKGQRIPGVEQQKQPLYTQLLRYHSGERMLLHTCKLPRVLLTAYPPGYEESMLFDEWPLSIRGITAPSCGSDHFSRKNSAGAPAFVGRHKKCCIQQAKQQHPCAVEGGMEFSSPAATKENDFSRQTVLAATAKETPKPSCRRADCVLGGDDGGSANEASQAESRRSRVAGDVSVNGRLQLKDSIPAENPESFLPSHALLPPVLLCAERFDDQGVLRTTGRVLRQALEPTCRGQHMLLQRHDQHPQAKQIQRPCWWETSETDSSPESDGRQIKKSRQQADVVALQHRRPPGLTPVEGRRKEEHSQIQWNAAYTQYRLQEYALEIGEKCRSGVGPGPAAALPCSHTGTMKAEHETLTRGGTPDNVAVLISKQKAPKHQAHQAASACYNCCCCRARALLERPENRAAKGEDAGNLGAVKESLFWAAGFSFGPARVVKDVGYDCRLPFVFFGEELTMAMRLFTHGWRFFAPAASVVFHLWSRRQRPFFREELHQLHISRSKCCSSVNRRDSTSPSSSTWRETEPQINAVIGGFEQCDDLHGQRAVRAGHKTDGETQETQVRGSRAAEAADVSRQEKTAAREGLLCSRYKETTNGAKPCCPPSGSCCSMCCAYAVAKLRMQRIFGADSRLLSHQQLRQLGFGSKRAPEDFWKRAGIHWRLRKISGHAYRGGLPYDEAFEGEGPTAAAALKLVLQLLQE